jgi:hypothetical protein
VLLYNAAQEGLYCPVKNDRSAFDLFLLCPGTKNSFDKFCYAHEQRLRINLHYALFELMLPKLNLWFWNIPIRLSFNVWPSLVDGDEQQIATRVPAML